MQSLHTFADWDSGSIPNWREGVVLARLRGRGIVTMTTGLSPSVEGAGPGSRGGVMDVINERERDRKPAADGGQRERKRERDATNRTLVGGDERVWFKYQVTLFHEHFKITLHKFICDDGQLDKTVVLRAASGLFLYVVTRCHLVALWGKSYCMQNPTQHLVRLKVTDHRKFDFIF